MDPKPYYRIGGVIELGTLAFRGNGAKLARGLQREQFNKQVRMTTRSPPAVRAD